MLPKHHRLPKEQIPIVFSRGKRISTKFGTLIFLKNEVKISRFAIIIGKKTAKKATERNRIKRTLRQSIRVIIPGLSSSYDAVILAKHIPKTTPREAVEKELQKLQ